MSISRGMDTSVYGIWYIHTMETYAIGKMNTMLSENASCRNDFNGLLPFIFCLKICKMICISIIMC